MILRTVNNALSIRGVKERLVKGRGYFYFAEGDAASWHQAGVYVATLNQLSLGQWLDQWKELSGNDRFPCDPR